MQTVTKAQIIYDHDHGQANEGWYVRFSLADGQERDVPLNATRHSMSNRRAVRLARAEALAEGFEMPRGTTVEVR